MSQFDDSLTSARLSDLHRSEEERLVEALAPKYGYTYVNLTRISLNVEALKILSEDESRAAEVALFAKTNERVSLAVRNPHNPDLQGVLKKLETMGLVPTLYLVSHESIAHAWDRYHDVDSASAEVRGVLDVNPEKIKQIATTIHSYLDVGGRVKEIEKGEGVTRTSDIIELVFGGALALNASDIHIEPENIATRIRYRLDGVLFDVCDVAKSLSAQIISRLKLLSGLKLNVRRSSQDGRFTFDIGTRKVEVRSSLIPGAYGESMVMRLLDPDASSFKLENLGLSEALRAIILDELSRPNGALLTTGPTGSGKTTALYSFLMHIHTPELKILTLEDPVEYKLPGIVQSQVSESYSFAQGLRAMLRQDPDVILIGEIRDREVAETAIHAALTGHLVFSTLHTNSAAGAFARLIDIGVDPRMIGSAVNIILGQRLVRLLCPACKKERELTTEEHAMVQRVLGVPVAIHTVFDAAGCDACGMSGYKGRVGVFEAIRVDAAVESIILSDTRERVICDAAKPQGIPTMQQDALYKVLGGITSLDEASRVLDLYHIDD